MQVAFGVKYYHVSRRTCIEAYGFIDDTLITVEMQMQMQECNKALLDCFWSLDNWIGKYAKWIDECVPSSPEDIDLYTYEVETFDAIQYFVGDGLDSKNCIPGLLWEGGNPNSLGAQMQDNFWAYVYNTLSEFQDDKE